MKQNRESHQLFELIQKGKQETKKKGEGFHQLKLAIKSEVGNASN